MKLNKSEHCSDGKLNLESLLKGFLCFMVVWKEEGGDY